jgi:peptidoglycan/xylan/chitin deacetylase (PgdA/CDA1 family)
MIALTFDDAPHPEYVPRLLALFRAENVKVTFFLVGEQLKLFPDVARAMVADGHEIGNHSLNHRDLRRAAASLVESEIVGMQQLIKETIAVTSTLCRPPFGNISTEVKRACDREQLSIILWDVDTNDWREGTTREMIVRNVLSSATSGSIVLFHATHQKTVEAVSELVPILRQKGLEFVTVSRLLQDRALREEMRRFAPKKEPPPPTRWKPTGPERYRTEPAAPTTFSIQTPILPTP